MKSFWGNEKKFASKLKGADQILLFLDFDGTLSPIVTYFKDARIDAGIKKELKKLAGLNQIFITIISGRGLESIREKVNLPSIDFSGNHGLEWMLSGKYHRYALTDDVTEAIKKTKRIFSRLEKEFDGIFFEDKSLSLSLHHRTLKGSQEDDFRRAFLKAIASAGVEESLKFVEGKKVIDARPKVGTNKGKIVKMIKDTYIKGFPIVIGDDVTDEDMFKEAPSGLTIRVGKNNQSKAKYYVEGIKDVQRFLGYIYELVT